MGSSQEPHFLRSIMPTMPDDIASAIRRHPTHESLFESLVRFLSGAPPSQPSSDWEEKQIATRRVLDSLTSRKRTHSEGDRSQSSTKRQRLTTPDDGDPLFTLHSISTTSPIRKKVDITIRQSSVVFTNPLTKNTEASVRVSALKRAFVVPTRGKSKAHWTVVILANDVPEKPPKGKQQQPQSQGSSENQQIIFGIDASSPAAFITTSYSPNNNNGDPNPQKTHPKNTSTLPIITHFLSHINNIQTIIPAASTFKSASSGGVLIAGSSSASSDGIPGIEAYRAAKAGNLWFSDQGILWGESKPCEFWDVKDLSADDGGGLKIIGGTGRTCTVVLTRRRVRAEGEDDEEGGGGGEETEFGMVDARERGPITAWIRRHGHLFGTTTTTTNNNGTGPPAADDKGKGKGKAVKPAQVVMTGPMTINTLIPNDEDDDEDDEDEEFTDQVSDLNGSEASSDEDSSDSKGGQGSEDDLDQSISTGEGEDDGDLDPAAHHPLLRPGAVPRMSKAALDMAVGIVEDVFMGGGDEEDADAEEEDQLED